MRKILVSLFALLFMACVSIVHAATIAVVGEGEVAAPPDTAAISLDIRSQNKDATKAQARNVEITRNVLAILKSLGVKENDITQSFYSFSRDQNRDGKDNGFYVSNSISVKLSDFALIPKITTSAISEGATSVGQPDYSLADDSTLFEKARVKAYQRAAEEAEKSAKAMGLKLGKVTKVSVGAAAISNLLAGEAMMGGGMARSANYDLMPELRIEPIKVKYYVTVEYDLIDELPK
jgi:uncharacterized protein